MSTPSSVAIIGAGLAGPALALCLKKVHGISCTIYELRPGPDDRGTNIALTPNALRVLQHVGVYDTLRRQGYNYEELALSNGYGQQLANFLNGSEKLYNFCSLRIHRNKVQKALLDEVQAQNIQVCYGMKLLEVNELVGAGVELAFDNGQSVKADFVIGADGVHSRVRRHMTTMEAQYSGFLGITGSLDKDQLHESQRDFYLPNQFFGRTGFIALMPSSFDGREIGFFSTMEFPERTRNEWEKLFNQPEEIRDILTSRFDESWPAVIQCLCKDTPSKALASWPFYVVPASLDRYSSPSGRVVIMGDAAHAITPQGGQGAAMALEDAATLAYTMSRLDFATKAPRLLGIWQLHRQQRMRDVRAFTNRNSSLRDPGNSYLKQTFKENMLWAAFKYMGPSAGLAWLYSYNAEDIIRIIRNEG